MCILRLNRTCLILAVILQLLLFVSLVMQLHQHLYNAVCSIETYKICAV